MGRSDLHSLNTMCCAVIIPGRLSRQMIGGSKKKKVYIFSRTDLVVLVKSATFPPRNDGRCHSSPKNVRVTPGLNVFYLHANDNENKKCKKVLYGAFVIYVRGLTRGLNEPVSDSQKKLFSYIMFPFTESQRPHFIWHLVNRKLLLKISTF